MQLNKIISRFNFSMCFKCKIPHFLNISFARDFAPTIHLIALICRINKSLIEGDPVKYSISQFNQLFMSEL